MNVRAATLICSEARRQKTPTGGRTDGPVPWSARQSSEHCSPSQHLQTRAMFLISYTRCFARIGLMRSGCRLTRAPAQAPELRGGRCWSCGLSAEGPAVLPATNRPEQQRIALPTVELTRGLQRSGRERVEGSHLSWTLEWSANVAGIDRARRGCILSAALRAWIGRALAERLTRSIDHSGTLRVCRQSFDWPGDCARLPAVRGEAVRAGCRDFRCGADWQGLLRHL